MGDSSVLIRQWSVARSVVERELLPELTARGFGVVSRIEVRDLVVVGLIFPRDEVASYVLDPKRSRLQRLSAILRDPTGSATELEISPVSEPVARRLLEESLDAIAPLVGDGVPAGPDGLLISKPPLPGEQLAK